MVHYLHCYCGIQRPAYTEFSRQCSCEKNLRLKGGSTYRKDPSFRARKNSSCIEHRLHDISESWLYSTLQVDDCSYTGRCYILYFQTFVVDFVSETFEDKLQATLADIDCCLRCWVDERETNVERVGFPVEI